MFKQTTSNVRSFAGSQYAVPALLFVFLLIITSPVQADLCVSATPVDLNSSLRAYVDQADEPLMIQLDVPAAGILSVDVSAPGFGSAEPRLGFERRACAASRHTSEPLILERSANHMVLVVEVSGSYFFRVVSRDPRRPLTELKVSSAFVADGGIEVITSRDGEDEEEIEIEADPWVFPGGPFTKDGEDEEEIEIEADPLIAGGGSFNKDGEDEEEIEIEADPLVHHSEGEGRSLHSKLAELCLSGEVDDHGDSLTCATFLKPGQGLSGEIRNAWGDDTDIFQFVLGNPRGSDLWTVEIETDSAVDVFGTVYDFSGQQLVEHGVGGDSRIVRTLRPGAYFVRIAGRDGAEGAYALRVLASPW